MREKVLLEAVVVFLVKDGKVQLAQKINKKGEEIKIGEDAWNGYGGGIKKRETPKEAAIRETLEETRRNRKSLKGIFLRKENLELRAVIYCYNTKSDGRRFKCKLFVFFAKEFSGVAEDSDEMINNTEFPVDRMPYEKMIPTDKDWFSLAYDGELFIGRVFLGNSQKKKLGKTQIKKVSKLDCN